MKQPELPPDEESRLATLDSLNVLDSPVEERFDRLTRLARRMFDVPIALVSLVDKHRQWFKSSEGLNVKETPRNISFCGHAILGDEVFIIPDASKDPRFADNPLVLEEPFIRFYAGCPLKYLNGSAIGTLCIIDSKPRNLSTEDIESLRDLAELAAREFAATQLATLDDLTKISNRRGFKLLAENRLSVCARQKTDAALVFLDLNNFKAINDNYGHAEGDLALKAFAEQMVSIFRESDVFARLGGDEFAALLANTSGEQAATTVKRLRNAVRSYNATNNRGYDLSFSAGIAEIEPTRQVSFEALLNSADSLMYKNKHLG